MMIPRQIPTNKWFPMLQSGAGFCPSTVGGETSDPSDATLGLTPPPLRPLQASPPPPPPAAGWADGCTQVCMCTSGEHAVITNEQAKPNQQTNCQNCKPASKHSKWPGRNEPLAFNKQHETTTMTHTSQTHNQTRPLFRKRLLLIFSQPRAVGHERTPRHSCHVAGGCNSVAI